MPRAWIAMLCLALVALCTSTSWAGTPYRVDDLLALESIGQVIIDPTDRIVLVVHRRRYDTGADYAYGSFQNRALSQILVASVDRPAELAPLFAQDPDAGYWIGSFSPSGKRLSVFRLSHRKLDLGVVDMATRTVEWLDVIPDLPIAHPAPSWTDDDHLVAVVFKTRRLPFILSIGNAVQTDLQELWRNMANGLVPSATMVDTLNTSAFADWRRVVRIDVRTGVQSEIAWGAITDVSVSHSGLVAIVSIVAPAQPPVGIPIDPGFVAYRHAIDIVGTGAQTLHERVSDDVLPAMMSWNADGTRLVYVARSGGRDWASARYQIAAVCGHQVAVQTLHQPPAVEGSQSSMVAHGRWAGALLLAMTGDSGGAAHWVAINSAKPDLPARNLGAGQLVDANAKAIRLRVGDTVVRIPLVGGRQSVTTNVVSSGTISLDPSSIGVRLLQNPESSAASVVLKVAGFQRLEISDAREDGGHQIVIPPAAKVLATSSYHAVTFAEDDHGVGTLALSSTDGPALPMLQTNRFLAERERPRIVEVKSISRDGATQSNWLFLPLHKDHEHLAPLVVMEYPGMLLNGGAPASTSPAFFLPPNNVPILVGHGFAVLMPSLPAIGDNRDPLEDFAANVDRAVDATIARKLIDSDRIAVLGHSFGGFGALALATRSKRYRGIVAVSGPYDLAAAHGSMAGPDRVRLELGLPLGQDAGWAEGGQAGMKVAPWVDPQRYIAKSPSYALDRITTPVLLLHGETDVVSMEQAERAFMGLMRLGKDATLVRYWGEGHVLASPANIRDYWARILGWLDARFADGPASESIRAVLTPPQPNDPLPAPNHAASQ